VNLCHPKPPAALLTAGQGGNLNSKGADILLIVLIAIKHFSEITVSLMSDIGSTSISTR
jgi:hypothetical protein